MSTLLTPAVLVRTPLTALEHHNQLIIHTILRLVNISCRFLSSQTNMASVTREYTVEMTCGGCSKAVNGVLTRTAGVSKVDIDLPTKKVVVEGTASQESIEGALKKTGKAYTFVK